MKRTKCADVLQRRIASSRDERKRKESSNPTHPQKHARCTASSSSFRTPNALEGQTKELLSLSELVEERYSPLDVQYLISSRGSLRTFPETL